MTSSIRRISWRKSISRRSPTFFLGPALKAVLAKSADKTVVLEGDRRAVLGTVVRVMDEGKKAGALKFAVATKGGKE
ncbi:MAG: biopolymer transporter ExbD [Deltaproteobacteria bacterium]|nr:biopolymer transporter ExbD [Deltaproteobacteria bacterium]